MNDGKGDVWVEAGLTELARSGVEGVRVEVLAKNLGVEGMMLVGAVIGIMALGRAGADRRMIENVARSAAAALLI